MDSKKYDSFIHLVVMLIFAIIGIAIMWWLISSIHFRAFYVNDLQRNYFKENHYKEELVEKFEFENQEVYYYNVKYVGDEGEAIEEKAIKFTFDFKTKDLRRMFKEFTEEDVVMTVEEVKRRGDGI